MASSAENLSEGKVTTLTIEFPVFGSSLKFMTPEKPGAEENEATPMSKRSGLIEILDALVGRDSLARLTAEERDVLWKNRKYLKKYKPDALPKLLLCVAWHDPEQVKVFLFFCYN